MINKTVSQLKQLKQNSEKIAVLTAYDASFTQQLEQAGIDIILVGDSLGMVLQGHDSTLPVTMDDMVYHTSMVTRVRQQAMVIADLPYHSYTTVQQAVENSQRLLNEADADMIKLEGGSEMLEVIQGLVKNNIPVCGHLGLLPQSVNELGGYKVQGRDAKAAEKIIQDAKRLSEAGVAILVLECIPWQLAKTISEEVDVITIGIGAGADCDGQVLVLYDMLGITPGKRPKFTHDFLSELGQGKSIIEAVKAYVTAVKAGTFPSEKHRFD